MIQISQALVETILENTNNYKWTVQGLGLLREVEKTTQRALALLKQ